MRPRSLPVETAGRDRWMVSYMDVLTVLLIFFLAVGAKSLETSKPPEPPKPVEAPKPLAPVAPLPAAPPKDTPPPEPAAPLRKAVEHKLEQFDLDWRSDPRGLAISLPQAVLFRPGKAQVNDAALPVVARIAEVLRGIPNRVSLDGHADPAPIHNRIFKSNWELAAARSMSLLDLLTTRFGIADSRFSITSYGSNDPRNPNDTPAGRASNRRVEILILDEPPAL